jgi:hypothetical protein
MSTVKQLVVDEVYNTVGEGEDASEEEQSPQLVGMLKTDVAKTGSILRSLRR